MSETPAPSATASFVTIVAFVIGGAAVGLAIAYGIAGGTPVAALVGFVALPVAFGAALAAWRAVLVAWLAAGIGRAALRSRASGESFTSELIGSIRGNPDQPRTALPGTWVFLPVTGAIGLVAALVMAIAAASNGLLAGTMLFVAAVGIGWLMRRLALDGRLLPIQE